MDEDHKEDEETEWVEDVNWSDDPFADLFGEQEVKPLLSKDWGEDEDMNLDNSWWTGDNKTDKKVRKT